MFVFHVVRRGVAQCGVGNLERLVAFADEDGNVRGHAGKQFLFRVVHDDDGFVGDHILGGGGRFAHLRDLPVENSSGNASTVKSTVWPSLTWPMSASEMAALMFILVMSWAMVNRTGVLIAAMTVWPRSTLREMTMPSTGAVILQ